MRSTKHHSKVYIDGTEELCLSNGVLVLPLGVSKLPDAYTWNAGS